MPEEAPKQLVIRDLRANSIITYSPRRMTIERRVNHVLYGCMMILGLASIVAILLIQPSRGLVFLVIPAAILFFAGISELSYFCEIDKEKKQVVHRQMGIFGTPFGKRESVFSLDQVEYLRIYQVWNKSYDTFGVKLVLTGDRQFQLPSETSLKGCMEYANIYKDFLELQTPIRLPK